MEWVCLLFFVWTMLFAHGERRVSSQASAKAWLRWRAHRPNLGGSLLSAGQVPGFDWLKWTLATALIWAVKSRRKIALIHKAASSV